MGFLCGIAVPGAHFHNTMMGDHWFNEYDAAIFHPKHLFLAILVTGIQLFRSIIHIPFLEQKK